MTPPSESDAGTAPPAPGSGPIPRGRLLEQLGPGHALVEFENDRGQVYRVRRVARPDRPVLVLIERRTA